MQVPQLQVAISQDVTSAGVRAIRPYQIFTTLPDLPAMRKASVKIPERQDLKLLETFLLIAACKIVGARRVFEFGTFLGSTTLNLAMNLPPDGQVFTFDLDAETVPIEQHPADARLTAQHLQVKTLDFFGSEVEDSITILNGNSLSVDLSDYWQSFDLVFVDGGHDLATIAADTKNAFQMVRPGGCIAWHDYGNPTYPDVAFFLNGLAAKRELLRVEDTMLCFDFCGRTVC
jgi:predicted O-methyltransferase YrrM